MFIEFKSIPFYYLNYEGYTDRRIKIETFFNNLELKYTRIPNNIDMPLRQDRIALGHIKLLEHALKQNIFPFIVADDDINLITNPPEILDIPENTDLIFLGGSLYECGGIKPNTHIVNYSDHFYRVYYMLGLTPTLIPNPNSAKILLKFIQDSLQVSEFFDITIAMHSKEYIYLTPKDGPYFYQDNYNEPITKFLWGNHLDKYLYSCQ
jgi:hypothetical protein